MIDMYSIETLLLTLMFRLFRNEATNSHPGRVVHYKDTQYGL